MDFRIPCELSDMLQAGMESYSYVTGYRETVLAHICCNMKSPWIERIDRLI